jgi:sulfate permease
MFDIALIPLLAAIFLAINMGGSGIAAAFSSSYGANLIRKDLIPGLFGAFVLMGRICPYGYWNLSV